MDRAPCVYVQHFNMHTHLKRHHEGVTITVAVKKNTISTTPVWEFRNANAITKFIGVFIAAYLRSEKHFFFHFPLN